MEFQKAMQQIKTGNLKPIYTFWGSEWFLQSQLLTNLIDICGQQDEELDITRLDLDQVELDQVIDESEMFSFFSNRRIVIVENANFLAATSKQKISDTQQKRLLAYLDNPNELSCLIFIMPSDQLDKRKKLTKSFQTQTCFVEMPALEEREVKQYISNYLANDSLKISREATDELLERVNYSLSEAMNEMGKLKAYASSGNPVSIEVVRKLVPRTLETDVFELSNAMLNKQVNLAAQIYQDLLLMRNEPIALHALIVAQFRLMIQVKLLASKGLMEAEIAKTLSVHPYRTKLALRSSRSVQLQHLVKFYQELIQVDYQMKTGVGIKETYFYLLLTKSVQL